MPTPHLFVIVDINPIIWGSYGQTTQCIRQTTLSFSDFTEQLFRFLSAHLLFGESSITILCCAQHGCSFLPTTTKFRCTPQDIPQIRKEFIHFVREQAQKCSTSPRKTSPLAGSLSKAMCCMYLVSF